MIINFRLFENSISSRKINLRTLYKDIFKYIPLRSDSGRKIDIFEKAVNELILNKEIEIYPNTEKIRGTVEHIEYHYSQRVKGVYCRLIVNFHDDPTGYALIFITSDKDKKSEINFPLAYGEPNTKNQPNDNDIILFDTELTSIEKEIIKGKNIKRFDL